jgi:hypothetical protein
MKKILLILTLALVSVSCKKETPEGSGKEWVLEVKYVNDTVDTLTIRSVSEPEIMVTNGVSVLTLGDSYRPAASYVKSIKILSNED